MASTSSVDRDQRVRRGRFSLTVLVACLTALAVSLALQLAWPRAAPAQAQAQTQERSMALASAASPVADRAVLIQIAKSYVRLQAEREVGVTVDRQQVTRFSRQGTQVVVSLHETLSNWNSTKTFDVDVTLNQGVWHPLGMHVVTYHGAPPIGVPAPAS